MARWLASLPKEEALRILRAMAEDLATEEAFANVLLLRPPPEQKDENRERKRAIAAFRRFLPVWLAAIDEEG